MWPIFAYTNKKQVISILGTAAALNLHFITGKEDARKLLLLPP